MTTIQHHQQAGRHRHLGAAIAVVLIGVGSGGVLQSIASNWPW